jgi:23S rRNA (guanosine2251-2'-O)-methyltransferase
MENILSNEKPPLKMKAESEYIFGLRPVIEAIRAGKQIDRLLVKEGLRGELYHELMTEVRKHKIVWQTVPAGRIELVTRKNHQGVLAWLSLVEYQDLSVLLPMIFEKGEDPLIVALDGVSDVRNFGAVVRSADCLGAHAVLIPEKGSARITADAVKASAGALNTLPVCREKSLVKAIRFLKESGLKVICAAEKSEKKPADCDLTGPAVLVMGSENRGISREINALADNITGIQMSGNIASLNVSVAAGILLYEINRQRRG